MRPSIKPIPAGMVQKCRYPVSAGDTGGIDPTIVYERSKSMAVPVIPLKGIRLRKAGGQHAT